MSNWADELIANQLGFPHCVLFPRARDAIKVWTEITGMTLRLPSNVCPVALTFAKRYKLHDIDATGLAPGVTVQLYGYREEGDGNSQLDLDPLGTGFFSKPCATSAIVSFGQKKFITTGGAAFASKDLALAQEMEKFGYFPPALGEYLQLHLRPPILAALRDKRMDRVQLWDRHLGDLLQRIPREQIIPWRVMRLAPDKKTRDRIVYNLRLDGFDVGTNYPPLPGVIISDTALDFGNRVLNFFVTDDYDDARITLAVASIYKSVWGVQ